MLASWKLRIQKLTVTHKARLPPEFAAYSWCAWVSPFELVPIFQTWEEARDYIAQRLQPADPLADGQFTPLTEMVQ